VNKEDKTEMKSCKGNEKKNEKNIFNKQDIKQHCPSEYTASQTRTK
jgi:hypothetical protein